LVFAKSAGLPLADWLFRLVTKPAQSFASAEAFFEKHLPLIREAARNDSSSAMMDGRFVPYGGIFWGRQRETAAKTAFAGRFRHG